MSIEAQLPARLGDYELIDFGRGRVLERWGDWLLERPDPGAAGEPALPEWEPDWIFVSGIGEPGRWQACGPGQPDCWPVRLPGFEAECCLGPGGRAGPRPREFLAARWVAERLEGCYHIDDLHVLSLFGAEGVPTAAALEAGARVTHVDADGAALAGVRARLGRAGVDYVQDGVLNFVEGAIRRQERFDLILINAPRTTYGGAAIPWDSEIDLPRLIKALPKLVSRDCRGIWLSTLDDAWTTKALAQLLREVLPGRTLEALELGVALGGRSLPAGRAVCWFDETDFLLTGTAPLTAAQLEERIEPFMTSGGAAEAPARALAELDRAQQDFVLRWMEATARTATGIAYQFVSHAARAFRLMDEEGVEAWLIHCLDIYDTSGLHAAATAFRDVEGFARARKARASGVAFDDLANMLESFVQGLNGRRLKLEAIDGAPWTDTETLFLPRVLDRMEDREANFRLMKAMAVHLWAQTWYGTWRIDLEAELARFPEPGPALECFHALETLRLDAAVARDLPGVAREMAAMRPALPAGPWQEARERLSRPEASVRDSLALLAELRGTPLPEPAPYQGRLEPARVAEVRACRLERDRAAFIRALLRMEEEMRRRLQEAEAPAGEEAGRLFGLEKREDESLPDGFEYQVTLDGKPLAPPDDLRQAMQSIQQDLGEIPPEYLHAAGDGGYDPEAERQERDPADVWKGTYHEEGAFHYNEWDHERQHYRKNWVVLRELEVSPQYDGFVEETLRKYGGLVKDLRRTFEALRGEDRVLKRQAEGDDVDIDALVEAWADSLTGLEMSDRLFTKKHKLERDIAVMFMVDMSGSTKGWINDAEREALTLLSESLEILGDRYAIYGFSGMTRKRCEVYRVKSFDDPYDEEVKARISGIRPHDYTRMGVAIRHLCGILNRVEARTRLLITLSDGKPDDYDGYRGAYGIEDTRQALIEAKRDGIHAYCITIDTEARDYLPHMYGAANYTVIDEVRKLPLKVSDIYRRLTT